jgi:choline dehydrogenase-like flavoprotein
MKRLETDILIVGTGPGGATLARELAGRGREVAVLEKGRWHRMTLGRYASVGTITRIVIPRESFGFMARGISVGGSTVVFTGNAYDPPRWMQDDLGIDLSGYVRATREEIGVKPLPQEYFDRWPGTRTLIEAAGEIGLTIRPQDKYINPDLCDPDCDDCMIGCRRGAKWTARDYAADAVQRGARLYDRTTAKKLIIENGAVKGVTVRGPHGFREVRAEKTVLAAGGMGTPVILIKSGLKGAGTGFFIDPMNVLWGLSRYSGSVRGQTFAAASEDFIDSDEFMIGTLGALFLKHWAMLGLLRGYPYGRVIGMFAKLGDDPGGRIDGRGRIFKPYTKEDKRRFKKGTDTCREIMIRAGVVPGTILVLPNVGGHPGGTAAIGRVVDRGLKAYEVDNLYVCDASVFPRSPGRPPSLTIIALAKRLAESI